MGPRPTSLAHISVPLACAVWQFGVAAKARNRPHAAGIGACGAASDTAEEVGSGLLIGRRPRGCPNGAPRRRLPLSTDATNHLPIALSNMKRAPKRSKRLLIIVMKVNQIH